MGDAMYTVGQLADMAGITVRALHWYEEQGLLEPQRRKNGYRAYGPEEVARLQQVLLFRACGMQLSQVKEVLDSPGFDAERALERHAEQLRRQRDALNVLLDTVDRTLANMRGEIDMTDKERFEGLKQQAIDENERRYGAEVRQRYGDDAVDAANERLLSLTPEQWQDKEALEQAILDGLKTALPTGDPAGAAAQEVCRMHEQWIRLHWGAGAYSPEAHRGLAHGYLADSRFTAYYDDRVGEGATEFFVAALDAYLG